jgi:hypothetical protein
VLEKLAPSGALMKVGDEYRLQTKEGSEWDAEFRAARASSPTTTRTVQIQRDQLLYAEPTRSSAR